MLNDDTKPANETEAAITEAVKNLASGTPETPPPYPYFERPVDNATDLPAPDVWLAAMGGPETINTIFPHNSVSYNMGYKTITIYTHRPDNGGKRAEYNHGIDAVTFVATPSSWHFDIFYLRGCEAGDQAREKLMEDPSFRDADPDEQMKLLAAEKPNWPKAREFGGFYVVTATFGVPMWGFKDELEKTLGVTAPDPGGFRTMQANAEAHVLTQCDCPDCANSRNLHPTMATRFAPIPVLDADRRLVTPHPAATLPDKPTTADDDKVAEALKRMRDLGFTENVAPETVN